MVKAKRQSRKNTLEYHPRADRPCSMRSRSEPQNSEASDLKQSRCRGVTLIELIVVLAVMTLLMALTLPAVQWAREAARRTQCRSHLRQIGIAAHAHVDAYQHLPTNGWGYQWLGHPDRGFGRDQPGGWIYNLLPFLDQTTLREMGSGLTGVPLSQALGTLQRQNVPTFRCPTRPAAELSDPSPAVIPRIGVTMEAVAKSDYAICEGDFITNTPGGPATLLEGDTTWIFQDVSLASGVSYLRSHVRLSDVTDGLSNTLLAGEKHVNRAAYASDVDPGFDQSMFCGVDLDISRWTIDSPLRDSPANATRRFGSAHSSGCHIVLCDGSVRQVSYSIDTLFFRHIGNRHDEAPDGGLPE